jgi:hypothetical protein
MVKQMIYEFRLSLRDIGIPVWRDIQVDCTDSFHDFNTYIQALFDWSSIFEHRFEITRSGGVEIPPVIIEETSMDEYEALDEEGDFADAFSEDSFDENYELDYEEAFDEDEYRPIGSYFVDVGDQATYTYFTDAVLEIEIILTEIVAAQEDATYPLCTGAENLAPEEMDDRGDILQKKAKLISVKKEELVAAINKELALLGDAISYDSEYEEFQHDLHFDDDEIYDEPYDAESDNSDC